MYVDLVNLSDPFGYVSSVTVRVRVRVRSLAIADMNRLPQFWFVATFGRPFVKRFALCYRTVVCLSVLSVTLVCCGQTVGWIKMKVKFGMEV